MTRTLSGVGGGLAAGAALAFLLCLGTAAAAVLTGAPATIPGIFSATAGRQDGALAIEFVPGFHGLLFVAAAGALTGGICAFYRSASAGR